jgi:hypothetical protein
MVEREEETMDGWLREEEVMAGWLSEGRGDGWMLEREGEMMVGCLRGRKR